MMVLMKLLEGDPNLLWLKMTEEFRFNVVVSFILPEYRINNLGFHGLFVFHGLVFRFCRVSSLV